MRPPCRTISLEFLKSHNTAPCKPYHSVMDTIQKESLGIPAHHPDIFPGCSLRLLCQLLRCPDALPPHCGGSIKSSALPQKARRCAYL